jgi:hypothetical protein
LNGGLRPVRSPITVALIGGGTAVAVGIGVMLQSGGEQALFYVLVNAAAVLVGLTLAALLLFCPPRLERWLALAAAIALLTTAFVGLEIEGIRRWASLFGAMQLQPAFIVLPLLLCTYARRHRDSWQAAAVAIAALAIAIMPDRAMAMALLMVAAAVWLADRTRASAMVLAGAVAAFGVTLYRPDPLMGVVHVEHVLADGWHSGLVPGAVVTFGALAMLAPLLTVGRVALAQQRAIVGFTCCWGILLIASIVAPFPTPLLGFGASAIIGYCLSIMALRRAQSEVGHPAA